MEVIFILVLLALPSYYGWKGLAARIFKSKNEVNVLSWTLTILVTPVIYAVCIYLVFIFITYERPWSFDKDAWLLKKEQRYRMAGRLIHSGILIGKNEQELKLTLGAPTTFDKEGNWHYDMGMSGEGLGFAFHSLLISFDESGKVRHVEEEKVED